MRPQCCHPKKVKRFFWALFLLPTFALSDDGAWTYVGTAGSFTKNTQVRMMSERVNIDLRDKRSHFHVEFDFRNEGPATTVTMAFPEECHNYPAKQAIHDFVSTVDGSPVRVTRKRLPQRASEHDAVYVAVWRKKVSFKAHQSRKVV